MASWGERSESAAAVCAGLTRVPGPVGTDGGGVGLPDRVVEMLLDPVWIRSHYLPDTTELLRLGATRFWVLCLGWRGRFLCNCVLLAWEREVSLN